MTVSLQTRFPITFAKCEEYNKKHRKYEHNIITYKGVTYDKSVIPILSDDEIENFVNLQIKYPETINNCFNNLIELLELHESQIITRKHKKQITQHNPITKMYDSLIKLNEHNNMENIDKWILFIKSQNGFYLLNHKMNLANSFNKNI